MFSRKELGKSISGRNPEINQILIQKSISSKEPTFEWIGLSSNLCSRNY
jgi:hypothetical protein